VLPGQLRHGAGEAAGGGGGRVAEHAGAADGSVGDQRDEGSVERGAEPEHAGRVVDRRVHRGGDRLGAGRAVRHRDQPGDRAGCDAASLYDKLEKVVVPLFYRERERFVDVMRHAMALNGSFFNTQRMVLQYVLNAYFE